MANPEINRKTHSAWDYVEDEDGIVYCIGKQLSLDKYEAIAAYRRSRDGSGSKISLEGRITYDRLMLHGLPEEDEKLQQLDESMRRSLKNKHSSGNACFYIDPVNMTPAKRRYANPTTWITSTNPLMRPFAESLITALQTLESVLIAPEQIQLYGGSAFGLVAREPRVVDDIDLLLDVESSVINQYVHLHATPFTWHELDPAGTLSKRRLLLKAKRWSTSQVRLSVPYPLSIDLKLKRHMDIMSLWSRLPRSYKSKRFIGKITVTDNNEVFCISPALIGIDKNGIERIILIHGYPYIGCAMVGDVIEVRGVAIDGSSIILVSQSADDMILPDLSDVDVI